MEWDGRRSSWTGLSAALELSDIDLGPDIVKSEWVVEYLGTNSEDAWL